MLYDEGDLHEADAAPVGHEFAEFAETLQALAKRIRALFGIALAEAGYQNGQDHLLISLVESTAVQVSVMAARLDVRPSTISKMIGVLEEKGLIERISDLLDHRRTLIQLTEGGVKAQSEIRMIWTEVGRKVASEMPDKSTPKLLDGLNDVLAARLRKLR